MTDVFQPDSDDAPPDKVRSAAEVATRAIAVCCTMGVALGAEREAIAGWLTEHDLWHALAPSEAAFIKAASPTKKQIIDASWLSERLIVLLWALDVVSDLPPANEQCDTSQFLSLAPPFASFTVGDFVTSASLRSDAVLNEKAEELLQIHWEARDARLNNRAPRRPVDMEIIQERHHAINWVTGYCGLDWDDVTTDT